MGSVGCVGYGAGSAAGRGGGRAAARALPLAARARAVSTVNVRGPGVAPSSEGAVLGPENLNYSADYPSEMRRYIEQEMGSGVMAFFLQGAPGDINPYYDKTPLIEDAVGMMKQTGRLLGVEAVRVARTVTTRTPGNLRIQSKTVVLSVANRWNLDKLRAVLRDRYHIEA